MPIFLKRRLIPVAAITIDAGMLLTGCSGGAQDIDPAGKNPGSESNFTNPAQEIKLPRTVVSDAALQTLTKNSTKGGVCVAGAAKS